MPLFEVVILEVPNKKELADGGLEHLAFGPVCVIAADSQTAAIKAILDNPGEASEVKRERMQVLVRPFA